MSIEATWVTDAALYVTITLTGATPPVDWAWGDGDSETALADLVQGHGYQRVGLYTVTVNTKEGRRPFNVGIGNTGAGLPPDIVTREGAWLDDGSTGDEAEAEAFNPTQNTIDEVLAYVDEHPEEVQVVYDAESDGKGRVTLLEALRERGANA